MFNPNQLEAAIAAALSSFCWGALTFVACLFGEPPPTRRQVVRAGLDWGLGVFLAVQVGYAAGESVAGFVNGLAEKFVGVSPELSRQAGGLLVGALVLRGVPVALDWLERKAKAKAAAVREQLG